MKLFRTIVLSISILFSTSCLIFEENDIDPNSALSALRLASLLSGANSVTNPTFSPTPGFYNTPQHITIASTTPDATIYYSLDGTEPTTSSTVYSAPIHIWLLAGKVIKAVAVKSGLTNSAIVTVDPVYSYPLIKTGAGSLGSYTLEAGEDGLTQKGVARSFTLPTQSSFVTDFTIYDPATDLTWRSCRQGVNGAFCELNATVTMNWTDAQTGSNGCGSLNSLNSGSGYAGKTNWRLPNLEELNTIINYGRDTQPLADIASFPNILGGFEDLSSTSLDSSSAMPIMITIGQIQNLAKTSLRNVRCVSGNERTPSSNLVDMGDGTVRDYKHGLVWQKCSQGQTLPDCAGALISTSWSASIVNCNNLTLAGRSWRLPNTNELYSLIVNHPINNPTINTSLFPNTGSDYYNTSTTSGLDTNNAFLVNFGNQGYQGALLKSDPRYVRCVSDF